MKKIVAVAALMALSVLPARAHHPEYSSYQDLIGIVAEWQAMGATIYVPATSENGRAVYLVEVGTGPITILYSNVLHAEEPSGSEAFIRFVYALLGDMGPTFAHEVLPGVVPGAPLYAALADPAARAALLARVKIVGFPMMDPDGFDNNHTRDFMANTDYATKITEQSAALEWAVETFEPDLYLDSHGGPDSPDLNIGLVEPIATEPATLSQSRRAAETSWRVAAGIGASVAYFEEHIFEIILGTHDEPFASADETYWTSISKGLPVTQASYQLEGLPAVYTETVGLQSVDPSISISAGASAQQTVMAGLAFEAAGMLTGQVPQKTLDEPATGRVIELATAATDFFAAVRWKLSGQDYELRLVDDAGAVVAGSGFDAAHPATAGSRSRAIEVASLPAGRYTLEAIPRIPLVDDDSTLRAVWRTADPNPWSLGEIADADADVRLCLSGTAYGDLMRSSDVTAGLASRRCPD